MWIADEFPSVFSASPSHGPPLSSSDMEEAVSVALSGLGWEGALKSPLAASLAKPSGSGKIAAFVGDFKGYKSAMCSKRTGAAACVERGPPGRSHWSDSRVPAPNLHFLHRLRSTHLLTMFKPHTATQESILLFLKDKAVTKFCFSL